MPMFHFQINDPSRCQNFSKHAATLPQLPSQNLLISHTVHTLLATPHRRNEMMKRAWCALARHEVQRSGYFSLPPDTFRRCEINQKPPPRAWNVWQSTPRDCVSVVCGANRSTTSNLSCRCADRRIFHRFKCGPRAEYRLH